MKEEDDCFLKVKKDYLRFLNKEKIFDKSKVEKIESLGHELIIAESRCKINHNTDHSIEEVINIDIIGSKIEATYQAVVEFIKEHNRTNDYNKVTYYDGQ